MHNRVFSVYKAPSTSSDTVTDSREAKSTEDCHGEESDISESSDDNEDNTSTIISMMLLTVVQVVQHLLRR